MFQAEEAAYPKAGDQEALVLFEQLQVPQCSYSTVGEEMGR